MRRKTRIGLVVGSTLLAVLVVVISIPVAPTIPKLETRSGTRYWEMEGGYRIAWTLVAASPAPSGPPIVVTHGGPGGYIRSSYSENFSLEFLPRSPGRSRRRRSIPESWTIRVRVPLRFDE